MKTIFYIFFVLCPLLLFGQEWEFEKHDRWLSEEQQRDSVAMASGQFIPRTTLSIKSQFPIQQAFGVEITTPARVSAYAGIGRFSRFYTLIALDALPNSTQAQSNRIQFIKDKLEGRFIFELGGYYHFIRRRGLYAGLNIQFQSFAMPTTPVELVEEYNFGDPDNFSDDIQDLIDNSRRVRSFYENTIIEPTVRPIQLGFLVGKRFRFKKQPRLALHAELSYHLNLSTRTSVESPSIVGRILVNRFITPILENRSANSFDGFNLPAISLRLSYSIGKIIRTP